MLNSTLQLKVKQRLNKLDSQDYDNLECWQIIEAFNKAMIEWTRRQIMGRNLSQEGAEQTVRKVDDLQNLLQPAQLTFINAGDYYETEFLPQDYLEYHKIDIYATKDCCTDPKKMIVYLVEEANSSILLRDELRKPNFEWGETFCTIVNNKIRVYTNNDFQISEVKLLYFRKPVNIQIVGCGDPYTGTISTANIECEFRDDITEILIDSAASIIAGDIESFNQYQREQQAAETNT
jgi:hypothetical protein